MRAKRLAGQGAESGLKDHQKAREHGGQGVLELGTHTRGGCRNVWDRSSRVSQQVKDGVFAAAA